RAATPVAIRNPRRLTVVPASSVMVHSPVRRDGEAIIRRGRLGAMMRRLGLLLVIALALGGAPARAQYPLFDAHIHYSRPDWDAYTPERALSILAQAGVQRALVSSTPDDGTLKLYDRAPAGIVPSLRPYRTGDDVSGWPH